MFVRKKQRGTGYREMFKNGRTSISVEIPLSNIKKFPGLNFTLL